MAMHARLLMTSLQSCQASFYVTADLLARNFTMKVMSTPLKRPQRTGVYHTHIPISCRMFESSLSCKTAVSVCYQLTSLMCSVVMGVTPPPPMLVQKICIFVCTQPTAQSRCTIPLLKTMHLIHCTSIVCRLC